MSAFGHEDDFPYFLRTDFNCIQLACENLQKDVFLSTQVIFSNVIPLAQLESISGGT